MFNRKKSELNNNYQRERYSNFVVDLRQTVSANPGSSIDSFPKKDSKKKDVKGSAKLYFKNNIKKISPNLLSEKMAVSFQFKSLIPDWKPDWKINFKELGFRKKKKYSIKKSFAGIIGRIYFLSKPRKKSYYRKILAKKQNIFNSVASASPRLRRAEKRASAAERVNNYYRSLFSFAIILLLIILPIKVLSYFKFLDISGLEKKIMNHSQSAINNLMAASDAVSRLDFNNAESKFQNASSSFLEAEAELAEISDYIFLLASLSDDPKIKMAAESKKFLRAGAVASSLGRNLVLATDSLFVADNVDFGVSLNNFLEYGYLAVEDAVKLEKIMLEINPDNLPSQYRLQFENIQNQSHLLADNLSNFISVADKLKEVLGLSRDKRYLLIFQNNAELRASGGFLGSYALVDLREGKIRNLEVPEGGTYDTEAGMKSVRVAAPEPLWLVNPLWHFWDANWWPDWPTTAGNLMWFYSKSDGPSVDGVISVTPTVVERLLEITGPIDLREEYGVVISSENFWETVQKITEQKNLAKSNPEAIVELLPGEDNKPKKIIGDMMSEILNILPQKLDKDNLLKIIMIFEESMSAKHIMFYFTNPALQAEVSSQNWAGEIKSTDKDYLSVINTNIAGQKTDRVISEKIEHSSMVDSSGEIINTVKITRTHNGRKNEPLVGVRNVNWLRVYVPLGSELIEAEGFRSPDPEYLLDRPDQDWQEHPLLAAENAAVVDAETGVKIYSENEKTVFANWTMVDPGETSVIILKYRLPFNFFNKSRDDNSWWKKINDLLNPEKVELLPYSLLVQKQPGAPASDFFSRLILQEGLEVFWHYPDSLDGDKGWELNSKLDSDKYWLIVFEK